MVAVKSLVIGAVFSLAATLCSCTALPHAPGTSSLRKSISNSGSGVDTDGFYWNLWTDGTKPLNYENGPEEGTYTVTWGNGTQNFVGGKGWNPGARDRNITYSADFKTSGNAYLCVYGWALNDPGVDIEYYVIEWFGSYDPTSSFIRNASQKVTIVADGGTYAIGRYRYVGMGFPTPFIKDQVYSVREAKDRRTSGTINMKLHFDAWEQKLGMKFGTLDYQLVATEGYMSTGEAKVKVERDA